MSFLKEVPSFSGVVVTDHASEYTNPYYHSRLDDLSNINLTAICEISEVYAKTLFLLGVNNTVDGNGLSVNDISVDCSEIVKLYNCFTFAYDCALVRELNPNLVVSKLIFINIIITNIYSKFY